MLTGNYLNKWAILSTCKNSEWFFNREVSCEVLNLTCIIKTSIYIYIYILLLNVLTSCVNNCKTLKDCFQLGLNTCSFYINFLLHPHLIVKKKKKSFKHIPINPRNLKLEFFICLNKHVLLKWITMQVVSSFG